MYSSITLSSSSAAIHSDPAYYDQPDDYDALRFARVRESFDEEEKVLDKKQQATVSIGENFMSFRAGRHACPGRFFAAQEMKLMLAYIVNNYDVRLTGPRPQTIYMKNAAMPDLTASLQFRLRQS
ncbi:Cytochrome P450 monooxygenase gloP [Fulvia fulva]|uniref:Cytochrome P450 monooxygenase gloP n=1 Tax=Passalora fulva TaxID=5499 RepID=A0A9Q8PHB1_PASFU|nr:Cytochrome P450 monooxygenase gloP [Fulvia fulva]KAK4613477.1 Cytochrome P450 monooxygenase gloP [Fulvia fulva]KAK4614903.1 Cytochrome P450 monooxygenase gloP [Fulvia fulva]UJO22411.1 Cytochrome P450 monooxygenase gloP [Fulvia fulva]WPV20459.1 Cytochrome P450 monooxygenase gloP [Fulvia fulva]WPV35456.1 Cytochrome P450 monooxygenase gloP [Fulvia fulva]